MTEQELAEVKSLMPTALRKAEDADVWIKRAEMHVSRCYFGKAFYYALALYAAHIGTLETRGNGDDVGSVTSKREGDLSVSYGGSGSSASETAFLNSTNYGVEYLDLLRQYAKRPQITGLGFRGC